MISLLLRRKASTLKVFARSAPLSRKAAVKLILISLVLYLSGTLLTTVSTYRASKALSDVDAASALAGGDLELDRLDDALRIFNYRMNRLESWLSPVQQSAKISILLPPLDRQRRGFELLLNRVRIDYDTAMAALQLGRSILLLRETTLDSSNSIEVVDDASTLKESVAAVRKYSHQVLEQLDLASDVGIQIADLDVAAPIASINDRIARQEEQLRTLADFSYLLSEVLLEDIELLSEMSGAIDDLKLFGNGELSVGELSDRIGLLEAKAANTNNNAEKLSKIAPSSIMDSEYGELVTGLSDLNRSVYGLINGIDTTLKLVAGSFGNLIAVEGSLFDSGEAVSATLTHLIESEDELDQSVKLIGDSISDLLEAGERGPISLGSVSDAVSDRVQPLVEIAELLKRAAHIMEFILGADGIDRTLIILGQNSDELRASGGFTSNLWRLNFNSGALKDIEYFDVASFEDLNSLDDYPGAVADLDLHMAAGRMYIRDVGWDPNFPSAGSLAADLFEIRNDQRVDAVISLTQGAFVDLVSVNGQLEVDSRIVEPEELLDVIQIGTDDEGTEFLPSLFRSFIETLSGELVGDNFVNLLTTLKSLFSTKDIMIFTENPEIQHQVQSLGWDGALDLSQHDRLAVVDSNVGWNKVDRNIGRRFSYEVDLTDPLDPRAHLTLVYRNDSVSTDKCELQAIVTRSYAEYLHGCYWNYIRAYIAIGAEFAGGDNLPMAAGSVAVSSGARSVGSKSVNELFDENGTYVSGLLTVPPQSERVVTVGINLPQQVLWKANDTLVYSLDLVSQAGAIRPGTITILPPDGYEVVSVNSNPAVSDTGKTDVTTNLDHDEILEVIFRQVEKAE